MKKSLFALAAAAALPLLAATGDTMAETASDFTFKINTKDSAVWLYSTDDVASFPVTWREGETVTVTDRSGDVASGYPSSAAASGGSAAFSASSGGTWTLVNSGSGTAYIAVPWLESEVDTLVLDATDESLGGLAVDTVQTGDNGEGGIDRKCTIKKLPGFIAYSGDDWAGGSAAECTLKFTSPSGTETTQSLTGTGAETFTCGEAGTWTVELIVNSTTVRKATIDVLVAGLTLIIK